jgi:phage gp36-like protein
MPQALAVELAASALVVASGEGTAVDIGELRRAAKLTALVTGYTIVDSDPTPGVVLTVQTRATASLPWRTIDTISVTATGAYPLSVGGLDQLVRVTWTLTNMTSCEFAVSGYAHVVYCDPSDIVSDAVPEAAIEDITASARANACISASEEADGYLNSAYELPLSAWGLDLRSKCAEMAAAKLFRQRGFDPDGPDKVVMDTEKAAIEWLNRIANGRLKPPGIVDTTTDDFEGGSFIATTTSRGW